MPRGGAAALRAQYGALREASDGTYTDDAFKPDDSGCGWACACAMVVLSLSLVGVVLVVLVEFVYEGGDLGGGGGAAVKVALEAAKRANVSLHLPALNVSSLLPQERDPNRIGHGPPDVVFWKLLKVGGSTICTILVKYAEKNNLSIVVPDDDQLEGLVGPGVRQPRPLSKGDPMDALLGMDQHSAAEQWNLANGGTKRRDGKGRLNGGNNKNKQNKQNKKSGPHVPRPRHFRPNGHMGDKSRHAQQRGKLAGRRLLSFERQHNCKDFDPNTTNVGMRLLRPVRQNNSKSADVSSHPLLCCHGAAMSDNIRQFLKPQPQRRVLQLVTLRDPLNQLVSFFYYNYRNTNLSHRIPNPRLAVKFFQKNAGMYLKYWAPYSYPGNVCDSLKQMEAAAQEGLTVLLFERMDESIVLLLDMLDMPLSAGLADSGKVVVTKSNPHPKPSDWPPEVVMGFKNMATRVGYYEVYHRAEALFDRQIEDYGKELFSQRVAEFRALKAAMAPPPSPPPPQAHSPPPVDTSIFAPPLASLPPPNATTTAAGVVNATLPARRRALLKTVIVPKVHSRLKVEEMQELTDAQWNKLARPAGGGDANAASAKLNAVDVPPTATFNYERVCNWQTA